MNRKFSFNKTLLESNSNTKSESSSLRGLNFGRLYLKNGEFETAMKYVNQYLIAKPNSSEGYKLLAEINEAIGDNESAIVNYRKSLDLRKQTNDNYVFVTPTKNGSFSSSLTTTSSPLPLAQNNNIENSNNYYNPINERKPITPQAVSESVSHSCGICSNENLFNKMVKQQENLMETNKIILDIIKQNSTNINDVQQQLLIIHDTLNNLTDGQSVIKETLYDYVSRENECFEDYVSDDKENDSFDTSALLSGNNLSQWNNSLLQMEPQNDNNKPMSQLFKPQNDNNKPLSELFKPQNDNNKPLSELFKPPTDSWQCGVCYVQNDKLRHNCIACETPNPTAPQSIASPINETFKISNTSPFSFQPKFTSSTSGFNFGAVDSNTSNFTFKFGANETNTNNISFNSSNLFSKESLTNKSEVKLQEIPTDKVNQTNWQTNNVKTSPVLSNVRLNDSKDRNTDEDEVVANPDIYFKPVIPLPELIEVKTGEEDEEVVYCQRGKLYRYDSALKEWKERGIGDFKILKHKYKNRYRMILRRDQILKIACNHYINSSMALNPMNTSETAICWSAVDFSEGNPVEEQFALKLKNKDLIQEFIKVFKKCQNDLEDNKINPNKPEEELISDKPQTEIVSNKSEEKNLSKNIVDDDLEVVYVKMPKSKELLQKTIDLKLPLNFYDYEDMPPCPGCRGCRDEQIVPKVVQPFSKSFNNNESLKLESENTVQESLFSSAIAASQVNQTNWQTNIGNKPLWLVNTPTPVFSNDRNADDDEVVANPDIYFKPVIPLPELIEVKTGEEDEEVVYCQRGKLYRYDSALKEWKERGIGDFKILKHKYKNRYRMILRRDQILKIACNHYINSSMALNPMNTSETAICWSAVDFSEGNPVEEQFALKLKNKELLQEFIKTFNRCKRDLENNESSSDFNNSVDNEDQNDGEDTDVEEDQEQS